MKARNSSDMKAAPPATSAPQHGDEVIHAKTLKPESRPIPSRGLTQPRVPGSMAGKIGIAPDFDSMPQDIADAFGATEPEKCGARSQRAVPALPRAQVNS
jgi:hypothetical protein